MGDASSGETNIHRALGETSGGYLRDIPDPHVRRWPGDAKPRDVRVHIMRYYGIGIHYYATVEEEDNPLWDEATQCWRVAWDDDAARGRHFDSHACLSYHWAKWWAKAVLEKHFQGDTYRAIGWSVDEDTDDVMRWFQREGD
jgi:hypothetical protein